MKVCISGAFCTGKTTVFEKLLELENFDGSVPDLPRSFQQQFPDVDWSHSATRHFNFLYQCLRESQAESRSANIICDGGIHECIGHTRILSNLTFGPELFEYHKRQYNLVLLCADEGVQIEDDGLRHTNIEIRTMVQREIERSLEASGARTIVLRGAPEERLSQAKHAIEGLLFERDL